VAGTGTAIGAIARSTQAAKTFIRPFANWLRPRGESFCWVANLIFNLTARGRPVSLISIHHNG